MNKNEQEMLNKIIEVVVKYDRINENLRKMAREARENYLFKLADELDKIVRVNDRELAQYKRILNAKRGE